MEGSMEDKLRLSEYIVGRRVLDVGSNGGELTHAFAERHPNKVIIGLEKNYDRWIKTWMTGGDNIAFRHGTLESLHPEESYDTIIFSSVLHEIFSYGHGHASVMKALATAYEHLNPGGRILIRDMMRPHQYPELDFGWVYTYVQSVEPDLLSRYESHSPINNKTHMNEYLIKAMWPEHWDVELQETYMATSMQRFKEYLRQMNMRHVYQDNYLLPYFERAWKCKYGITNDRNELYSHGILVYEKV